MYNTTPELKRISDKKIFSTKLPVNVDGVRRVCLTGHDFVSSVWSRPATCLRVIAVLEESCEPKIANLQITVLVQEEVLALDIT